MSGDEADESSVGDTSYEDDDTPLPISPFKSGTDEPFKIVFKGGRPWGFGLKGGTESKAPLQISQVNFLLPCCKHCNRRHLMTYQ